MFLGGIRIGIVQYESSCEEIRILQLQIHPDYQGQGYGGGVIEQLLRLAGQGPVSLAVLKGNPAIRLYLRAGFKVVGEDDHEYHMKTDPCGSPKVGFS